MISNMKSKKQRKKDKHETLKLEYDKESHKKFIFKKNMNSYIKMIKWKKNDEDAKNLHENMKIKDEHEEEARLSMNRL